DRVLRRRVGAMRRQRQPVNFGAARVLAQLSPGLVRLHPLWAVAPPVKRSAPGSTIVTRPAPRPMLTKRARARNRVRRRRHCYGGADPQNGVKEVSIARRRLLI